MHGLILQRTFFEAFFITNMVFLITGIISENSTCRLKSAEGSIRPIVHIKLNKGNQRPTNLELFYIGFIYVELPELLKIGIQQVCDYNMCTCSVQCMVAMYHAIFVNEKHFYFIMEIMIRTSNGKFQTRQGNCFRKNSQTEI